MHIAVQTYSLLPVRGYGGAQRVIVWLVRGLVELGHRVTLLALPGSRLPEATVLSLDVGQSRRPGFNIDNLLPKSVDLLHAHGILTPSPIIPHVFTVHSNLRAGRIVPPSTIFLSADHARRHGSCTFVHNGVDPSEFVFRSRKADYDLFLGRLHRVKGYHWAIEGCKRTGRRLLLAGGWRPSFRTGVRFVGTVDGRRKADLLADASCLWMPALWDEPFGLTLVEALISGTPVLGSRRGALPEIVSPEVGALGDTLEELVELRPAMERCDPAACRSRAETCFSHIRMAQEYVRMYQHALRGQQLPPGLPAA